MNLPESDSRNISLGSGSTNDEGAVAVECSNRSDLIHIENGEARAGVIVQHTKDDAMVYVTGTRQGIELLQGTCDGNKVVQGARVKIDSGGNDTSNLVKEASAGQKEEGKEELQDDSTVCNSIEIDVEDPQNVGETNDIDTKGRNGGLVISFPSRNVASNDKDDSLDVIRGHQRKPHHILMERMVLIMVIVLVIILAIGLATMPSPRGANEFFPSTSEISSLSPTPASIAPP